MKHIRSKSAIRLMALLLVLAAAVFVFVSCSRGEEAPSDEPEIEDTRTPEEKRADEVLEHMTIDEKIAQLFIVTPEGLTGGGSSTETGDVLKKALDDCPVGGLIYFDQNLKTPDQTKSMLAGVNDHQKSKGGIPLFLSVDEEGGLVARCAANLGTTRFEPMYTYREKGADAARSNAETIARDISELGFNLDFAPVADTWSNPNNKVIGTRAYSSDFDEAAVLVPAAVEGFHAGGAACVLKHFPGHGDTDADSHAGEVISSRTLEELRNNEFKPFIAGMDAGADMVMVGHITMAAIDGEPATFSKKMVTDVLRGELGYEGVVITDALNMGAVANKYDPGEAACKALEAGCDVLLYPQDLPKAIEGIRTALNEGRITEERLDESVRRILILKAEMGLI